jgi:hypothetical protein
MITIHVAIGNLELSKWGEHKRATAQKAEQILEEIDKRSPILTSQSGADSSSKGS